MLLVKLLNDREGVVRQAKKVYEHIIYILDQQTQSAIYAWLVSKNDREIPSVLAGKTLHRWCRLREKQADREAKNI